MMMTMTTISAEASRLIWARSRSPRPPTSLTMRMMRKNRSLRNKLSQLPSRRKTG